MIVGTTGAVDALGHPHTDNDENEYEEATDDKHKETTMAKKKVKPAQAAVSVANGQVATHCK